MEFPVGGEWDLFHGYERLLAQVRNPIHTILPSPAGGTKFTPVAAIVQPPPSVVNRLSICGFVIPDPICDEAVQHMPHLPPHP